MLSTKRRQSSKAGIIEREAKISQHIPYLTHLDPNIVVTKSNDLLMVIKLEGFSFETADDDDLDIKKQIRSTLLRSLGQGNYALWFHIIRKRHKVDLESHYINPFADELNKKWEEKHKGSNTFVNELYITLVTRRQNQGALAIEEMLRSFASKADPDAWKFDLKRGAKDIRETISRIVGTLREYKPKILGYKQTPYGNYSEIIEFLGTLVNSGQHSNMRVPSGQIDHFLCNQRLYFGWQAIEARTAKNEKRYIAGLSVKEYCPSTSSGMLDAFLQMPFELIISQSFDFINRQVAIGFMSTHQRRMSSGGDKAISQLHEITDAMDATTSGHIAFGNHHMSVFVVDEDLASLEESVALCYGELVNLGITPYREKLTLQATYWAQLPGNFKYIGRSSMINTMNMASFASLHNYPIGSKHNNHWGPAVTVFDTTSGTPYFFNFHVRDVGHTTIIGPTGSGKTVLMNLLCAQAQKFNCRMFVFDKDRGADIFVRAIGGIYSVIDPAENVGFNPLQLEDTYENRSFLADWLRTLVLTAYNQPLTPEENDRITEAIAGNYKLPKQQRKLSNIAPFLGLEGPGTLAGRLRMWHSGNSHSKLFDNAIDNVDFTKSRVFGFEMGEVLQDGLSISPVLEYLFHRISMSLDGTPTIVVLDEAWALIDNEIFAPKIKDWLKTMRKLNAMVIFATQSVEDASKSDISDTLIQQTATQIFLPNPKATSEYRKTFMLTEREFQIIKTTNPGSRYFLVKQGPDVIVSRIDLSGMENFIRVLSGRTETVALLDQIRQEVGDDPDKWLPIFYERSALLEKQQKQRA